MKKFIFLVLLSLFVSSESYATKPAQWYKSDWTKFIDAVAWGTLGDGYTAVGGRFPLVDVYSALSAAGGAVKPGLQIWLRRKMEGAVLDDDLAKLDRYQAFYSCLTSNSCDHLHQVLSQESDAGSPGHVVYDISGTWWSINYTPDGEPVRYNISQDSNSKKFDWTLSHPSSGMRETIKNSKITGNRISCEYQRTAGPHMNAPHWTRIEGTITKTEHNRAQVVMWDNGVVWKRTKR